MNFFTKILYLKKIFFRGVWGGGGGWGLAGLE